MEDKKLQNSQKEEKAKEVDQGVLELIDESLGDASGGVTHRIPTHSLDDHFERFKRGGRFR